MFIINKPSMLFDFVIMEVTWYFISCKHEWFSLKYHERLLNLLFTLRQATFNIQQQTAKISPGKINFAQKFTPPI